MTILVFILLFSEIHLLLLKFDLIFLGWFRDLGPVLAKSIKFVIYDLSWDKRGLKFLIFFHQVFSLLLLFVFNQCTKLLLLESGDILLLLMCPHLFSYLFTGLSFQCLLQLGNIGVGFCLILQHLHVLGTLLLLQIPWNLLFVLNTEWFNKAFFKAHFRKTR